MSGINSEYTVYLKVLTPVHIGGAQEKDLQEDLDTLFVNNELWKIDWPKVYKEFSADEISEAILKRDGLYKLLGDEIESYGWVFSEGYGDTGLTKTLIRDGMGKTFIPGSSIKGAIKNWIYSAFDNNPRGTKNLFGSFESDLFRYIKPMDCYIQETSVFPVKTYNLFKENGEWCGGWKHHKDGGNDANFQKKGFVTDFECFSIESEGMFKLSVNVPLKSNIKSKIYSDEIVGLERKKGSSNDFQREKIESKIRVLKNGESAYNKLYVEGIDPIKILFENLNNQTQKHLEREKYFFEKFKGKDYDKVVYQIEKMLQISQNLKDACLLRLSAGSGFHGITGDYQYEDHTKTGIWHGGKNNGKMKYKSRKIAFTGNEKYLMGFVLLSTEPFETNPKSESAEKQISEPQNLSQPKIEVSNSVAKDKDAKDLKPGDIVTGEIIELDKPFCKVKLHLTNYPFVEPSSLSGTKKFNLKVGQIVKCELGNISSTGEYKQVKFIP